MYKSHFLVPIPTDLDAKTRAVLNSFHARLDSEFRAIQKGQATTGGVVQTFISGGGGGSGGGGSSAKIAFSIQQTVSGAGTQTVNFPNISVVNYGVVCMFLKSDGSITMLTPDIDPLTDSRTGSSFTVQAFEGGSLWSFVILQ